MIMTLPTVSILISTYARTAMLTESIYSALNQNYAGRINVTVINACAEQTLRCDGVNVLNVPQFTNGPVGVVRDLLVRSTTDPLCMIWDDDDIYMPDHVAQLVAKLRDGEPAARLREMLVWNGEHIYQRGGCSNAPHTTIFRREAYGKWPYMFELTADIGVADLEFWLRVSRNGWYTGRHHHERDGLLTCLLRDDRARSTEPRASDVEQGHISPDHLRALAIARITNNEEPRGLITITPSWSRDWLGMVNEFTAGGKAVHE